MAGRTRLARARRGVALGVGIWDATYYLGLEILAQWPASLVTQDVYFLLPVPWGGPVWVPLLADALMGVLAGWLVFGRRSADRAVA